MSDLSLVIMEEACILLENSETGGNTPNVMKNSFLGYRKYGIGCWVVYQVASAIPKYIYANAQNQIWLGTHLGEDIRLAASTFDFIPEMKTHMRQGKLGTGLIFMQRDCLPDLFDLLFPDFNGEYVSDKEIEDQLQKAIVEIPGLVRMKKVATKVDEELNSAVIKETVPAKVSALPGGIIDDKFITDEKRFLNVAYENPYDPTGELYRKTHVGTEKGTKLKDYALANGYILVENINLHAPGGQVQCIPLTRKGCDFIGLPERDYQKGRNSSFLHEFIIWWAVDLYRRQSYECKIDGNLNGVNVDILAYKNNACLAVQVCTSNVYKEITNLKNCIHVGARNIRSIVVDKSDKNKLEELIGKESIPADCQVEVRLAKTIFRKERS
jgi:hypothetical protein